MAILLNDNLDVAANKPTDARYGPYATVEQALGAIPEFKRYIGLTVGVGAAEYWFRDGILDINLVEKKSKELVLLPAPKLQLRAYATPPYMQVAMVNRLTGEPLPEKLQLKSVPEIVVHDIAPSTFEKYDVFLECAILNKRTQATLKSIVIPSSWTGSMDGGVWVRSWDKPWPLLSSSRSGAHNVVNGDAVPPTIPIKVDRPNHFPVTQNTQVISLAPFLNGRFTMEYIGYSTIDGFQNLSSSHIELPVPMGFRKAKKINKRYPYSARFAPLRIAARYLIWDSTEDTFITGPFSRVAKIWKSPFPFNTDHFLSSIHGTPIATINDSDEASTVMQTWIE